jgi:hypothetical protein
MDPIALGFRVKSGWAMAVLLSGPAASPKVIDRRRIGLADPEVPESAQPFHAGLDLPKGAAAKKVGRLVKCVERFSERSVKELLEQYRLNGYRVVAAGIVAGSVVNPATIKNDHIRAHAEEGRLFRTVIADALRASRLKCCVVGEKELLARGTRALGIPEVRLKAELTAMGKAFGAPWRAEEKAAALSAWMSLAARKTA